MSTVICPEPGMTPALQGRTEHERAENESYGGKGCLGIIVAVCLSLAMGAITIWLGALAGWW